MSLLFDDGTEITLSVQDTTRGGKVKLGIEAPLHVRIRRSELIEPRPNDELPKAS